MNAEELLRSIVRRNANGCWFVTIDGQHLLPIPKWQWATYAKLIPNPLEV